jgi:DMSO/TMAO reductase YedYZ molybdopterin-dependent catalytic subunit
MTHERSLVAATKPGLVVLDTPELNAETPAHLLDDDITPLDRLFVRNTGTLPVFTPDEIAAWTLTLDGCVERPQTWTIGALRRQFASVTRIAVLECAGNGRAFFPERIPSVPWRHGAVGCVAWTGVKLSDLLARCVLKPEAVYTGHFSPDRDLDGSGPALSRGLPIAKALAAETIVAHALNGEPIPLLHGGPLRIIAPGYPASASQKWLTRIGIRDREHDGVRMTGLFYRMPRQPVRPGEPLDPSQFEVLTDMPVRSLVTAPRDGFVALASQSLLGRGHAWSGHTPVAAVDVSIDGGRSWQQAKLGALPDIFAWRRFEIRYEGLQPGPVEITARATDAAGRAQPLDSAPWNPRGYCNNLVHRVRGYLQ